MKKASLTLTVMFEQPFWVGVFEYRHGKELSVAKVTFGKEPNQNEIYSFVLTQFDQLVFSPVIEIESLQKKKINPKRLQK